MASRESHESKAGRITITYGKAMPRQLSCYRVPLWNEASMSQVGSHAFDVLSRYLHASVVAGEGDAPRRRVISGS